VRRQVTGGRLGEAVAGGAPVAGRAQRLVKAVGVAQVVAWAGPIKPGDPGQRLARGNSEAFLLMLFPATGAVERDRGGVIERGGDVAEVVFAGSS
jgi:hypothetical protein